MKKLLMTLLTINFFQIVEAQDVIVKKDGSTIMSKVLEVNTGDVKYKKFSNQQGPTYTISLADILSINYENGEKDTFDSKTETNNPKESTTSSVNPESDSYNSRLIDTYNNLNIEFTTEPKDLGKKADGAMCLIGIKEGSLMYNCDLMASIIIGGIDIGKTDKFTTNSKGFFSDRRLVVFHLKNHTDKMLYIDMANTFLIRNGIPEPYYTPTATTKTSGTSSGVGVNLGAIAGALGVGGSLGTLAGGVNVGSGNTNSTSTTTFSQRVFTIPPQSALTLGARWLIPKDTSPYPNMSGGFVFRHRFPNLVIKGTEDFSYENSPMKFSLFITYAYDEGLNNVQNMNVDYYLRQAVGIPVTGAGSLSAEPCVKKNVLNNNWVNYPLVMIYNRNSL